MDCADSTGKGGNTDKGDVCQRLLTDHREVLVQLVPEWFQSDFCDLCCLWIAIKVFNSKEKINSQEFKIFCIGTYKHLFTAFFNNSRWISVSSTVHSLLAHGWELIRSNDNRGLGEYTEGGLENNKFLCLYRSHYLALGWLTSLQIFWIVFSSVD